MQSVSTTDSYVFKFVRVPSPRLIGPRGCRYYLANSPTPVPGRDHVTLRRLRTPSRPLFPANPPLEWHLSADAQRSALWGPAASSVRAAIDEVLRTTAAQLNVEIIYGPAASNGRPAGKRAAIRSSAACNVLHGRDIKFISSLIVAAARHYHEWHLAWAETLVVPRRSAEPVAVTWHTYNARTTERLRRFLRAAERGTQARLELQWHQAPPAMRYFIWRAAMAWPRASRHAVRERAVMAGEMISAPIPSREFLSTVLPEAIEVSARQRGRRAAAADVFLVLVREMFLMLVGDGGAEIVSASETSSVQTDQGPISTKRSSAFFAFACSTLTRCMPLGVSGSWRVPLA